MLRKTVITLVTFFLVGVVVFGAVAAANPTVGLPRAIEPDSACPAVGCASGSCHGFGDVPQPDGEHEMVCPEAGCASVECHAWDPLHAIAAKALLVLLLVHVAVHAGSLYNLLKRRDAPKTPAHDDGGLSDEHRTA